MHKSNGSAVFPSYLFLVYLELFRSPPLVCHFPLVMHATEVLHSSRRAPRSGNDMPGCNAVAFLPRIHMPDLDTLIFHSLLESGRRRSNFFSEP
jgi:hypothetical protein